MSNVEKERKEKPTEEKVEQSLTIAVVWCLPGGMSSATLSIAALQTHRELVVVASMHDEGLEVHTESLLQHVFNGANGGSCCHRDCI